jgi:hypothetical protein
MKISLVGAELEENLGLRYMAAALEQENNIVQIIPFNTRNDIPQAVREVGHFKPDVVGLSMVFTSRAREFCSLAQDLREDNYQGHIIAGGHFAALNCEELLRDFSSFDSVALGEGEEIICALVQNLDDLSNVHGLCYRHNGRSITKNPSKGNPENLDALPFPKRTTFHDYFEKPIASILSSRGCWRNCAFCSINAWYKSGGGKRFRPRNIDNVVAEMKELYFRHGVRIFNFQDDNFFLPDSDKALERFKALRKGLHDQGVKDIAIAVKARPDSITYDTIEVLNDLGVFRVFLGVENASEDCLRHLNRKCTFDQIMNAIRILNEFDVHLAFNLLIFEPDVRMKDILINLRFMERYIENPLNFCRAEAYAGTGLEKKLRAEDMLLGDYFGFDYRLKDPHCEAFHQIANYAFFDRNFSDLGLHYFNMQVDFYFQLLRRFHSSLLTETLRGAVKSFIKRTNLDTHEFLCQIYDFISKVNPQDQLLIRSFSNNLRRQVDARSNELRADGEFLIKWMTDVYANKDNGSAIPLSSLQLSKMPFHDKNLVPYRGPQSLEQLQPEWRGTDAISVDELFGFAPGAMPYGEYKAKLAE